MIYTLAAVILTAGMVAIGALHFIWAFSPWPLKDKVSFTKAVLGNESGVMPPPALSALVGVALLGGAVITLMTHESIPGIGPEWLRIAGSYGLGVVLLGRGVGGYAMARGADPEFQRLNAQVYSPLCIVLGLMSVAVAVSAS